MDTVFAGKLHASDTQGVFLGDGDLGFQDTEEVTFLRLEHNLIHLVGCSYEYKLGTYYNHEEKRERKLLLTHKELIKLQRKVKESGLTIVPVKVFLNEKGYAKLRIALAKGKKEFDKRESLKLKDAKKDMERAMKR